MLELGVLASQALGDLGGDGSNRQAVAAPGLVVESRRCTDHHDDGAGDDHGPVDHDDRGAQCNHGRLPTATTDAPTAATDAPPTSGHGHSTPSTTTQAPVTTTAAPTTDTTATR